MEYLRGLSLVGVLSARDQAALERAHALAIIRDVGAALVHAHSRSVVHGDLNPGNIFITNEGEVRVLDFGAAHPPSTGPVVSASQSEQLPVATPRYASPQLLEGKRADVRDDLYALACIAYQLISGKHPFAENTALIAQEQRLKPARPAGLNRKEWHALRAGLAFDRERRPPDVAGWLGAFDWRKAAPRLPVLLALVRVTPDERSSSLWPAVSIAAAVLIAVGLWVNHASHPTGSAAPSTDADLAPAPPSPASESAAAPQPQVDAGSGATASSESAASTAHPDTPTSAASAPTPARQHARQLRPTRLRSRHRPRAPPPQRARLRRGRPRAPTPVPARRLPTQSWHERESSWPRTPSMCRSRTPRPA
jgi:eukaryotic-like serine/threonine-protein kinase